MDENILTALISATPDAEQQAKTLVYFEEIKNSEYGWQLCLEALSSQKYSNSQIHFFCFQVIEHHVKTRHHASSLDHQNILRKFLCQWIRISQQNSIYLKNKVAQIVALVFVQDYPTRWHTFFNDLLSSLNFGDTAVDHYLRVLLAIDSEIADQFIERSNQEHQRNSLIKDVIREKEIVQLVNSWFQILTTFEHLNPQVARLCLQVIGKFVLWIDIGLVANDNFVPVLVKQLSELDLREPAAECIQDIINKGMDPQVKCKLVESFDEVLTTVGAWQAFVDDSDCDYLCKLGKLFSHMGENLIECYWKLRKAPQTENKEIYKSVEQSLHKKSFLMLKIISNDYDDVSLTVVDLARHYIHLLKNRESPDGVQSSFMSSLMDVIIQKLKYDDEYDFANEKEDEAEFLVYRKQLKVILDNMLSLDVQFVLNRVLNVVKLYLENWRCSAFQDAEVALALLYFLGEGSKTSGCGQFSLDVDNSSQVQLMLLTVMQSDVQFHNHSSVVLQYFEIVVRYVNFFQVHTQYVNQVLAAFLKENGVFHNDMKVRSRCAYLFCRFIKSIRSLITTELTEEILICIQPLLALVTPTKSTMERLLYEDDQLYLYEVAGMVIVSGERVASKKGELMRQAIGPLMETCKLIIDQLRTEKDPQKVSKLVDVMVQAISVTGRASKAFSGLNNMKSCCCSTIFVEALQVFLQALDVPIGVELPLLQCAIRQYLHRMVVCLEVDVLPYFPAASQSLLRNCDSKSIQEYIPLINQVITKFKLSWVFQKEVTPFLHQMFAPMVRCIFNALVLPMETNDLQAARERQMLQRQYYHFIAAIVTNNLTEVLSVQDNELLQQVMLSIIQGSVEFPDPVAQKACFSILKKLVEIWGTNGPEGFIDFMYKNIVPACFLAPLKPTFDLTDAQTLLALSETALCLKAIFDKRGDEFIAYVQVHLPTSLKVYLPTLEIPPAKIQEFISAIRSTTKYFKTFLKNYFQSLRVS